MKIYVITKGCYSDYHIIACTTDENRAKQLKERYTDKYEEANIEEYEDAVSYELKRLFLVEITPNGYFDSVKETTYYDIYEEHVCKSVAPANVYMNGRLKYIIAADSEEEAKRIALDKCTVYMARKHNLI